MLILVLYSNFIKAQNNRDNSVDYSDFVNKTINKPNNYTFHNYSTEGSVDPLTGRFGLNVNFHTIEDKYINIPITLQYSTSGVHLDDISNEIGIDWHLNAGGSITRVVKDVADEIGLYNHYNQRFCDNQANFVGSGQDISYGSYDINFLKAINTSYGTYRGSLSATLGTWYINFFPERRFSNILSEIGSLIEIKKFEFWAESDEVNSTPTFNVDTEPDIFRCVIGDLDFSFVFKRKAAYFNIDGGSAGYMNPSYFEAVPIDDTGIKIKYYTDFVQFYDKRKNYSPNGQKRDQEEAVITKFEITDKKGIVYIFENFDFIDADVIEEYYHNFFGQNNSRIFQWKTYNTMVNNWKIKTIKLPDNKVINFQYIANEYLYQKQVPRIHDGEYTGLKYNLSPTLPSYAIGRLDTHIEGYSISEISYENQKVKFYYSTFRPDLKTGGLNLDKIELWHRDQELIKSFDLLKTYSYADLDGGHEDYRMFLSSIDDSTNEKSYSFTYNNEGLLPPRSYVQYQDIFGYYLGYQPITNPYPSFPTVYIDPNDTTGNKICYDIPNVPYYTVNGNGDRFVNLNSPKIGTLKKIGFPTGGELEIEYENNTYFDPKLINKKALGPGVRVNELRYYAATGVSAKKVQYFYDKFDDVNSSSGTLLYKPSLAYISNWNLNNSYDRQNDIENNTYDYYDAAERRAYYDYYHFDHHYSKEKWEQAGLYNHTIYAKMVRFSTHNIGHRVDNKGREIIYPNVMEKFINFEDTNKSYSVKYYFNNVDNRTEVNSITGPSDEPNDYAPGNSNTTYSLFSPFLANTDNGNGYVKTAAGFIERKGYDIYPFPERNFFGSLDNQLFGKLLKKEYFDNNGQQKYTEEYIYTQITKEDVVNPDNVLKSLKTDFLKMHLYNSNDITEQFLIYLKYLPGSSMTQADIQNYHGLYMFSINPIKYDSKIVLENKKTTTYFNSGNIVIQQNFFYNNSENLEVTNQTTSSSGGNLLETKYSYAHEIGDQNLIDLNIIGTPLKEEDFKDGSLMGLKQINFGNFQDGTTYFTYDGLWIDPYVDSTNLYLPKSYSTLKGDGIGTLEEESIIDLRDYKGNILQYHNKLGEYTSMIWGYGNTQPVAIIENIQYSNIPILLITNIQVNSDLNSISESTLLNDLNALRTDPALVNAMVTTYTYKPLVGISTITDPKGNTTTYHYDSFGRLQYVKDKDGNILNENEYHYKN
ncbi:RHS repeat domain-containing protein [Flavobacterium sediminis]|nr:RHS repeat domain-containing protein [Flavobacterium sediminis]